MGVYIWTNSTIVNISSDLRGATLAGLQAQGWDTIVSRFGGYTLDSNGFSNEAAYLCNARLYFSLSGIDLSNRKLTIYGEGNIASTANLAGGVQFRLEGDTTGNSATFLANVSGGTTNDTGMGVGNTVSGASTSSKGSGSFTNKVEIDFSSGYVSMTCTGAVSWNGNFTMTSTEINNMISNSNYISFRLVTYDSAVAHTYTLASIKIE